MSGETQVEVQVQIPHHVGDAISKLSSLASSSSLHSSGGSTGDDSSGEDHHHHHHILPKKIRLKELKGGTPALITMIQSRMDREENSPEGDENGHNGSSGTQSLTSGENSDAEGDDGLAVSSHLKGNGDIDLSSPCSSSSKKMFECDVCNMRFSNGANMRRHRMRHSGIKPFECKVCQKRFFRKDHLAEHMATHSKLLPYRCPICNKGFQRQIAMRAHFQNEHVGGSQEMIKACPLCAYKAGSMKSLRVHFYSRHGIDLDNPLPNSTSILCPGPNSNNNTATATSRSPAPSSGGQQQYSELVHALEFEDREKTNETSVFPSHFLVPHIEMTPNSPYPHFPYSSDSNGYGYQHENGRRSAPPIRHQSEDAQVHVAGLSMIKQEVSVDDDGMDTDTPRDTDVQEMPEDLTLPSNTNNNGQSGSPNDSSKNNANITTSSLVKLLREDWKPQHDPCKKSKNTSSSLPRDRSDSSSGHSSNSNSAFQNQSYEEKENGSTGPQSDTTPKESCSYGRRPFPSMHECVYCGIIFPDKTLYFLHKGCHSEMNPWRCNICGELCNDVYDFNCHLLSKSHQ